MEEDLYTITGGPLKPHEYIQIKRTVTAADEAWVQNHGTTMGGTKKNPKVEMTIGDVRLALLKRMIVRWQLTKPIQGHDGSETQVQIEFSEQAIENLPRRISAYIHKTIDDLNPEDEEDETDFTPAANGHSGGSSTMTRNLLPRD
jgi:hypothetical protein